MKILSHGFGELECRLELPLEFIQTRRCRTVVVTSKREPDLMGGLTVDDKAENVFKERT